MHLAAFSWKPQSFTRVYNYIREITCDFAISEHRRSEGNGGSYFLKSAKPREIFRLDGNSTREITGKLDHFAGSFSSRPGKSISVDSIIATRSSEGIAGISLKIRG
jgi:hypothetical protein